MSASPLTPDPPEAYQLNDQQLAFFETFGFLRLVGWFLDDIDRITAGFEEIFAKGTPLVTTEELHFRDERRIIPGFVEHSELTRWLPEDPRVRGIVRSLVGSDDFEYAESDGNLFSCDTSWHADMYEAPLNQYHVKLSFYLDPLRADTGAIRMLPGTNYYDSAYALTARPNLRTPELIRQTYGISPQEVPGYVIETDPGDVVVWNFRTVHASFGGSHRRRLFSLNFKERTPRPAEAGTATAPASS